MDKREFLKKASLATIAVSPIFQGLSNVMAKVNHIPIDQLASDDDFWTGIRDSYRLKPDYINLENGYYCMMPQETLNAYLEHVKEVNYHASYYMRKRNVKDNKMVREKLAELAGCTFDELVITRNATEALDLVIGGIHWRKKDEAIMAEQDYGAMLNHFRLMSERYGVVNKLVNLPNNPADDEEIVGLYESSITKKTKLIMISHVVNINGQVLPVRKICDMAHKYGVEVCVDGAHAFAHLDFYISDLNCDYYGTSLHKWLSAPLGAGFLYVKKEKIKNLWPLFAERELAEDDIERINHTGTKPVHVDLGILNAIEYHNVIGTPRKQARLRFLKEYWTTQVKGYPNITVNTPWDMQRSCAIANVLVEGYNCVEMEKHLMEHYNIWTVPVNRPNVNGVRITPNVFTTTEELDVFVSALKEMADGIK